MMSSQSNLILVFGVGERTYDKLQLWCILTAEELAVAYPPILAGLLGMGIKRVEQLVQDAKTYLERGGRKDEPR